MKESGNMAIWMARVKKMLLIDKFLLILTLLNAVIGTLFYKEERFYEGEWKNDKMDGQGKKSAFTYIHTYIHNYY